MLIIKLIKIYANLEFKMPFIRSVSTLFPRIYKQSHLKNIFTLFCGNYTKSPLLKAKISSIFDNTTIQRRGFLFEPFSQPSHLGLRSKRAYWAKDMASFSQSCLNASLIKSGIRAQEISQVYTSSNLLRLPSIGYDTVKHLGFSPTTCITPLEGLGCVGGVSMLKSAFEATSTYPKTAVMTSTIDCASMYWNGSFTRGLLKILPQAEEILTHQSTSVEYPELSDNLSLLKSTLLNHIVCAALIGDGASSMVIVGDQHPEVANAPLQIIDNQSYFLPGTTELTYQHDNEDGFDIHISTELSNVVPPTLEAMVSMLLERNGMKKEDIKFTIVHPGGPSILKKSQELFSLTDMDLMWSWKALREVGNCMGATVVYALESFLTKNTVPRGGHGLLISVGPGMKFSASLLKKR